MGEAGWGGDTVLLAPSDGGFGAGAQGKGVVSLPGETHPGQTPSPQPPDPSGAARPQKVVLVVQWGWERARPMQALSEQAYFGPQCGGQGPPQPAQRL